MKLLNYSKFFNFNNFGYHFPTKAFEISVFLSLQFSLDLKINEEFKLNNLIKIYVFLFNFAK